MFWEYDKLVSLFWGKFVVDVFVYNDLTYYKMVASWLQNSIKNKIIYGIIRNPILDMV